LLLLSPAHFAACRFIGNPSFVLISSLGTLSPRSSGTAPEPQPGNFTRVITEIDIGRAANLMLKQYSFETNDNRFDQNLGFSTGEDFARYMIDCFEVMYEEGAEHPKLMSLALHDRLIGRPGRITGLVKFLDHITTRDRVWICTGRQIAEHWRRVHLG
jgi:hypothetical protein